MRRTSCSTMRARAGRRRGCTAAPVEIVAAVRVDDVTVSARPGAARRPRAGCMRPGIWGMRRVRRSSRSVLPRRREPSGTPAHRPQPFAPAFARERRTPPLVRPVRSLRDDRRRRRAGCPIPPGPGSALPGATRDRPRRRTTRQIARILDLIAAGDIYQANLTFAADRAGGGRSGGGIFARLRAVRRRPATAR